MITSVVTRSLSEEQVQEVIILPPSKSANEAGCLSGRVFVPVDFSDEVTPKLVREMKKSGLTVGVKNSPIEIAPLKKSVFESETEHLSIEGILPQQVKALEARLVEACNST